MKTKIPAILLFTLSLFLLALVPGPLSAAPPPLAAQYPLTEGSGTVASDTSGNGNVGTLQGDAGWTTGLTSPYALNLPGAGGIVDIPAPVIDTSQSFTVMAFVKLTQFDNYYQTFVSIDGSQVSGFYLQLRKDTGTFALSIVPTDAAGPPQYAGASAVPQLGVWYHIAGVYNATAHTLSFYVNGSLQQTTPYVTTFQATGHTVIGRGLYQGSATDFASGAVNDVRFYQAVVAAADIKAIALAYVAPPPPAALTIDAATPGHAVSPLLYGLMTEEINHSFDGGLYGELIQNRTFQDDAYYGGNPYYPSGWYETASGGAFNQGGFGYIETDTTQPIAGTALTTCLRLKIFEVEPGGRVGAANYGFGGIPVKPNGAIAVANRRIADGTRYRASFYAKASADFTGPLTVDIMSNDGQTTFAQAKVPSITTDWQKYTVILTTSSTVLPSENGSGSI